MMFRLVLQSRHLLRVVVARGFCYFFYAALHLTRKSHSISSFVGKAFTNSEAALTPAPPVPGVRGTCPRGRCNRLLPGRRCPNCPCRRINAAHLIDFNDVATQCMSTINMRFTVRQQWGCRDVKKTRVEDGLCIKCDVKFIMYNSSCACVEIDGTPLPCCRTLLQVRIR